MGNQNIAAGNLVSWSWQGMTYQGTVTRNDALGLWVKIGQLFFTPANQAKIIKVNNYEFQ